MAASKTEMRFERCGGQSKFGGKFQRNIVSIYALKIKHKLYVPKTLNDNRNTSLQPNTHFLSFYMQFIYNCGSRLQTMISKHGQIYSIYTVPERGV